MKSVLEFSTVGDREAEKARNAKEEGEEEEKGTEQLWEHKDGCSNSRFIATRVSDIMRHLNTAKV